MNPYTPPEEYTSISISLTVVIARKLRFLSQEELHPGNFADDSEDKIRRLRDDIDELRNIRERLEHIFYS